MYTNIYKNIFQIFIHIAAIYCLDLRRELSRHAPQITSGPLVMDQDGL